MLLVLAILPERGIALLPVRILLADGPNNPGPLCPSGLRVPGYIPPVWEVGALGIEVPGKRGGGCSPCSPSEELLLRWVSRCRVQSEEEGSSPLSFLSEEGRTLVGSRDGPALGLVCIPSIGLLVMVG